MLGPSISIALLSVSGLVSGFPTERRQTLGEGGSSTLEPDDPTVGSEDGGIISGEAPPIEFPGDGGDSGDVVVSFPKRSLSSPAGAIFHECSSIDLKGVESAFTSLVDAYGSSPDTTTYVAMQPLHDILKGCGMDTLNKRETLTIPTETTPVDVAPLEEIYAQLEAFGEPLSLIELISMDSILDTIEMNKGDVSKRWAKRAAAATKCSTERINAWRLGLFTIATSYSDKVPITIWLIAENLVSMLTSCGVNINMQDIFGLGTPVTGGLEPDPVTTGGAIVPDPVTSGGSIVPDPVVSGGSIQPDPVVSGGSIQPDPVVSGGSIVPDPVVTDGVTTLTPGKRDSTFKVWPGTTSGMVPDKTIPGGKMKPDTVYPGGPMIPNPVYTPPKTGGSFEFGPPVVGGLVPDIPAGSPPPHFGHPKNKRQAFGFGAPIVGGIVPDDSIPATVVISPRHVKCNIPLYEAMVTLEKTYGRACDGKLSPSILMAQQSLVIIIFRECGSVWDNWKLVNLDGGFVEIGPIYSSGIVPSD